MGRVRVALRAARTAGIEASDALLARAEAVLRNEDSKREELRAIFKKALADFDEARAACDVLRLQEIKAQLSLGVARGEASGIPEAEVREAEKHRRRVHNAIEDLKGQVRVYCRVRPLNSKEIEQGDSQALRVVDSMRLEVPRSGTFAFDGVFAPGSQEDIFEDCRDLIQSVADGHNVTIFAYGQTGAGKTYTLYGTPEQEGIASRAIRELFKLVDALRNKHSVTITGSMYELHRNQLTDLLRNQQRRPGTSSSSSCPGSPKLGLRTDHDGFAQVDRLVEKEVKDAPELIRLLVRGLSQRIVAANAMNAESSRSHVMFTVKVTSVDAETREPLTGKLLLCDLGGSERLKRTEAAGDQLKEAIEINKSLSALGDVIEAVAERRRQVPYRNHKLTQLLQDSLGGTAKTLMFVNVSPAESNMQETAMSLNYASRAKRITNGVTLQVPSSPALSSRRGLVNY